MIRFPSLWPTNKDSIFFNSVKVAASAALFYVLSWSFDANAGIIDYKTLWSPSLLSKTEPEKPIESTPAPKKEEPVTKAQQGTIVPKKESKPVEQDNNVKPQQEIVLVKPKSKPLYVIPKGQPADEWTNIQKVVMQVPPVLNAPAKSKLPETLEIPIKTINLKQIWNNLDNNLEWMWELAGTESVIWAWQLSILKTYNWINTYNWSTVKNVESFTYPLIYPWLKSFFNTNLSDFLKDKPVISKKVWNSETVIIVTKNKWNYVLGYYKEGKIYLGTQVSLWKDIHKTPEWVFYTWWTHAYHASSKYNIEIRDKNGKKVDTWISYPMPYAIELHGAIKIHVWKVNGVGRSHGCIRVPLIYILELINWKKIKVVVEY